jgi:hypothetical protein
MIKTVINIIGFFLLVVLVAVPLLLIVFMRAPRAHDAPSGWPYPKDCCSDTGRECRRVSCLAISERRDGWYYNGMVFTGMMLRQSGDSDCHACYSPDGVPHCILLPNRPRS